jgi:hypothetical protein
MAVSCSGSRQHEVVMVVVPACLLRALASVRVWRQRYRLAHVRPASDHHRHQEGRLPSVLRSIAVAVADGVAIEKGSGPHSV